MSYIQQFSFRKLLDSSLKKSNNSLQPGLPIISIIIPSFNQGQFIERTILSAINQNYPNIQIIIIDGGSTDGTIDILQKYDRYIYKWISEKDEGQGHAINKGFEIATGDLLCFQNSDDLFYPGCLNTLVDFYSKNSHFDCYYGDLIFIDENDETLEVLKTVPFNYKAQILEGVQIFNQSLYFKKLVVDKFGGIDQGLKFVIDYENILRWSMAGASFKKVPNLFGGFRLHCESKTATIDNIRLQEHTQVSNRYKSMFFENIDTTRALKWIRAKKLLYFVRKLDWAYILYRVNLK